MELSRRRFIQIASASAAIGFISPALAAPRNPYVIVGEAVSFIGLAKHPEPTFTGTNVVREVYDWDGVGYPCDVAYSFFGKSPSQRIYDADLCDFRKELDTEVTTFWQRPGMRKYPNVHAYVREKRFGEPVSFMLERLGYDPLIWNGR